MSDSSGKAITEAPAPAASAIAASIRAALNSTSATCSSGETAATRAKPSAASVRGGGVRSMSVTDSSVRVAPQRPAALPTRVRWSAAPVSRSSPSRTIAWACPNALSWAPTSCTV